MGVAVLVLCCADPVGAQPVPMPEVVAETPVIRPTIPATAPSVGTESARTPAAAVAGEVSEALDRTG